MFPVFVGLLGEQMIQFNKGFIQFCNAILGFGCLGLLFLQGCGPMNGTNPGNGFYTGTTPAASNTPPSPETVSFTQKHSYIVVSKLLNGEGDNNATPPGGHQAPDAQFNIRIVHNADMSPVIKNIKLKLCIAHVSSKSDPDEHEIKDSKAIQPQADGSFIISVPMHAHGNWEIHTYVTEADTSTTLDDEHVLPITN